MTAGRAFSATCITSHNTSRTVAPVTTQVQHLPSQARQRRSGEECSRSSRRRELAGSEAASAASPGQHSQQRLLRKAAGFEFYLRKQHNNRGQESACANSCEERLRMLAQIRTYSADSAPRVPRLKLSRKRTQRRSSGTVVPLPEKQLLPPSQQCAATG